ncbi:MAG: toll/interleukin-1 receptor domain-containing protein [Pseudomonadota bacterium]
MLDKRNYFISFNSADLDHATAINKALRAAGKTTHFHATDIEHAQSIMGWMRNALPAAEQVIGICSPDYFKEEAEYSELERLVTQWGDPLGWQKKLLYVEVQPCDYNPFDDHLKRITETSGMLPDAAAEKLLEVLDQAEFIQQEKKQAIAASLPEIHNFRRPRTLDFTGRDQALADLHKTLSQGTKAAITQVVAGMGGVGKTTLATGYVHRFGTRAHYGGLWWINAEAGPTADLAALATRVGLPEKQDVTELATDALLWLDGQTDPWLLIYDNAVNPDQVQNWLPQGDTRVIITSRWDDWTDVASSTALEVWDRDTTIDYLLAQTDRSDRDGAAGLAEVLGDLPLAANQAAAFLRDNKPMTFKDYAAEIQDRIDEERPDGKKGVYEETVYATLAKSIETLPQETQDLLSLISWLSPDGVELELLQWGASKERSREFIPDPLGDALRDKYKIGPLVAAAERLSLLRTSGEGQDITLITHRITQTVLRRWQEIEGRAGWDARATDLVNATFPFVEPATWELAESLMPHAMALAQYGPRAGEPAKWLDRLLNQAAIFRQARGDTDAAITLLEEDEKLAKAIYGERHESYTTTLSNLSGRYSDAGRYDEAEAGFLQVLEIEEDLFGKDAATVAITVNNLAEVYWKQKDFARAEPLFQRALAIGQSAENDGTYNVAGGFGALGALYDDWAEETGSEDHRARAQGLKEQAISSARAALGERHPDVSIYLHNLALFFYRIGDSEKAASLELRSLAILISLWGTDHPEINENLSVLLHIWDRAGQGDRKDNLWGHVIPEVLVVEMEMTKWVNEDLDNRHFGPKSFFADKPNELEFAKNALGIEADIDLPGVES